MKYSFVKSACSLLHIRDTCSSKWPVCTCNNTCTVWGPAAVSSHGLLGGNLPGRLWHHTCPTPEIIIISVRTAEGGNALSAAIWFRRTDVSNLYIPDVPTLRGRSASCWARSVRPENLHSSRTWSRARKFYFTIDPTEFLNLMALWMQKKAWRDTVVLVITVQLHTNRMSLILGGWLETLKRGGWCFMNCRLAATN